MTDDLNPGPIALPHHTRAVEVWITEPARLDNRGRIARWLEDHGITTGTPADTTHHVMLTIEERRPGTNATHLDVTLGERVMVYGRRVEILDHAHYKLWYEPTGEETYTGPDEG